MEEKGIQTTYASILEKSNDIVEVRYNVVLDRLEIGEYMQEMESILKS